MSSIDPISGLDLTGKTTAWPITGVYGTSINAVETTDISEADLDKITAQQLRNDKNLFIQVLSMYFRRARSKLSLGLYEEAQQSLKWYFQYLHGAGFYWTDFGTQVYGIKRYSAIFWNAIVINHLEGQKAQQAFTNKELITDLELALKAKELSQLQREQAQQFIQHLQHENRLPDHTNKAMDPSFKTLMKVSKFFQSHHMLEAAQRILLHAHVQQAINMHQLQYQMDRLARPTHRPKELFPMASHLFPFEKTGLPYTTAMPYLHDENAHHTRSSEPVGINYYTHNIHRVEAIDKDPNPEQQRKKRQHDQRRVQQVTRSNVNKEQTPYPSTHSSSLETLTQTPHNKLQSHPLTHDVFEHQSGDSTHDY